MADGSPQDVDVNRSFVTPKKRRHPEVSKDAVRVAIRIRIFNTGEKEREEEQVVHCQSSSSSAVADTIILQTPGTELAEDDSKNTNKFTFDWVLPGETTQLTAYEHLGQAVVDSVSEGFHGCVFAYGQTGSGKSHTIFGNLHDPEQQGMMPRICESLFTELRQGTSQFSVKFSYLEIYNEKIRDLLRPPKEGETPPPLEVRQHPKVGVFVEGLTHNVTRDLDDILRLLDFGNKIRTVAATSFNAVSSRSHAVVTLHVERSVVEDGRKMKRRAQLHIVDLAGSERLAASGAEGDRMKESKHINTSLWALGLMINGLAEAADGKAGSAHVPYRNSKLTYLLSESLMGNCRTVMLACCSPASSSHGMTEQTLRFASRAKNIKTKPVVNEEVDGSLVNSLRAEIDLLRSQLGTAVPHDEKKAIQEQIQAIDLLSTQLSMTDEELELQTKAFDSDRNHTLNSLGISSVHLAAAWSRGQRLCVKSDADPYLVNVCSDPLLSGCLTYTLPPGEAIVVGSDPSATIKIDGAGVQEQMCRIINRDGDLIEVLVGKSASELNNATKPPEKQLLRAKSFNCDDRQNTLQTKSSSLRRSTVQMKASLVQVFVNNVRVASKAQIKHTDRIRAGTAHTFELFVPKEMELSNQEDKYISGHISGLAASPEGTLLASEYAEQLRERYGTKRASVALDRLQEIWPLVETANDLTEELREDEDFELIFQGEIFSSVTSADLDPEVTVVLYQRMRPDDCDEMSETASQQDVVLCLWTVEKFKQRLAVMHEVYDIVHERDQPWGLDDDPDPWKDDDGVPLVNPGIAVAPRAPQSTVRSSASNDQMVQEELERLREQLAVKGAELEAMASMRDKVVARLVASQDEAAQLRAVLDAKAMEAAAQAEAAFKEEEIRAVLRPDWISVLGALRERRDAIEDRGQMHRWLDPPDRLLDCAQKLSCDMGGAKGT